MSRFTDRVVIVTGAGSGLGRATALRFASEGGHVAVLDLVPDAAEKVVGEIQEAGATARAYECDVSDPDSPRAAVAAVASDLGRPQVLVNSAGIGGFAHSTEETFERWSAILAVNLTGTFLMCQATLPYLLDGGGAIVNVASNAGLTGQPYTAAYCASKGGVVNLTRSLAIEYVRRGVRVNAVAPGGMNTPMVAGFAIPEGVNMKAFSRFISPLGYSEPEELAGLIAFIASDDAGTMVGSIVSLDGGITA
jgi:NAD(P)-dependent dehydrogenase (short-subunit alcohol dehydrogenase family)